jgi:hypothetical protein
MRSTSAQMTYQLMQWSKDQLFAAIRIREFTVSDFIATLNYHSHVEADDYSHSLTPPLQIFRT